MKLENHFLLDLNQLRDGDTEEFELTFDPSVAELDPHDEVKVKEPIQVTGSASVCDDDLIIQLEVSGTLEIPCALCQEPFEYDVQSSDFVHEESIKAMKTSTFDIRDLVREAFLLEIPLFARCGGASCVKQKEVEKFLKKGTDEVYRPFENL